MNPKWKAVSAFWRQRSRREQVYLAVMLVSVGVFAYWFALLAPLRSLAAESERRHGVALAEQLRLPGVLAELSQRPRSSTATAEIAALVQSASSAGIAVSVDAPSAPGRTRLRFQAAPAEALFGWLSQLRQTQGLQPLQASLRHGAAGLDGEVTFEAAGP